MEDDDLADRTQQLLNALDSFLGNGLLTAQLDERELLWLRMHRRYAGELLKYYRGMNGFTRRQSGSRPLVSAVSQPELLLSVGLVGVGTLVPAGAGAAVAPAVTGAAVGGTTVAGGTTVFGMGVGTALALVVLPFAAAAMLSKISGGPLAEVAGRKLMDAANLLLRDVLALGTLSMAVAITAEEAAKLSTDELLDMLKKVAGSTALSATAVVIAELIKRFPRCAGAINGYTAAARRRNAAERAFVKLRYGEQLKFARAVAAEKEAARELLACIASKAP